MTSGLQPNRFDYRRGASVNGKNRALSNACTKCRDLEKACVAVFSLEMSKEQLVMRMLSPKRKLTRIVFAPDI
jgi:replicative DNA helicase